MNRVSDKCRANPVLQDERGQAIVVIAFALVALVLFAGLALDAATIYAGQSRLKRAVDAAALAGVVELPSEAAAAARTRQFMLGNGFDTADQEAIPLFETARVPSTEYMQWAVTVTHRVPLLFLPMINFTHADVTEVAVAEYRSMVDVYTTQTGGRGIVGPTNLSNWGRWANPRWGDAYTPQCWTCNSGCAEAGAGKDFCPEDSGPNPDHSELYNEFAHGYPFRIHIPPAYAFDLVQIEILDPDGHNEPINDDVTISYPNDDPELIALGDVDCYPYGGTANDNDRRDACLLATGDDANPHWFLRMDENRSFSHLDGGQPSSYTPEYNTETEYRLFYHKQLADQSVLREGIGSTYVGGANDSTTDMSWVVAWTVDIDCDDGPCDIQHITPNEDGSLSLYLEVDGVSGYSKNGFDIWAGPPPTTYTVPANVNDRNIFLLENPWAHDSGGVVTYASGYVPMTTNVTGPITVTFAYVPPEAIGLGVNLYHFDNDAAAPGEPIDYYLEGVEDWHHQGTLSLNGTWSTTDNYDYQPPGSRDHDNAPVPDEFYGGYLSAQYSARFLNTSSWRLEYEGIVGDVFVRLIQ